MRARRIRGLLGAVGIGFALILVAPAPASAHNYLVDSTPVMDGTITELPDEFSVTTNEPLLDVSGEAAGFALEVRDSQGGYYGDGCLTVEGSTLSTAAALGDPGLYTVGWQVVSADGHTVDGEFVFTWEPAGDVSPASAADIPPSCGTAATGDAGSPSESGPSGSAENPANAGAVSMTDVLWVLGTVVGVAVILFGTLMLLTRRRTTKR